MKSKLLLPFLLLFVCRLSFAQSDRSFEAMGYDNQTITGITGSVSYFLKVKPDDNVNQSHVVLHIRASQVLNSSNSFVTVYMKDEEVWTQRVTTSPVDTTFTIVVPLNRKYLQPDGRFIKLKVGAKLSVSDEYCKDVDNPACWIGVKSTSYLSIVPQSAASYQRSLKEWIQDFNSIYTPDKADLDDLTAGGIIYTLLRQSSAGAARNIYTGQFTAGDTTPPGIITGLAAKLPVGIRQSIQQLSAGQGLIALVKVNEGFGDKYNLVVTGADPTGYKRAINALASNKRLSSAFSDRLLVNEALSSNVAMDNPSPLITTLEDLGASPALMEGIGALRQKFGFSLTDFNAIPNKLTFHLESYFSVLKQDDRGFINIYLNQNLIYNATLMDKVNFIGDIDLQPYLLSKFNTLEVEFRFHPGTNICKDGFSNFFAFINTKNSQLTFSGEKENKFYSFFNFPAEFRKVPSKIIVSPELLSGNIISSIGEIYYQLNSPIKNDFNKLIVPQVIESTKANLDDLRGFNLIALLKRTDGFMKNFSLLPVQYDKDFTLYKDSKGQLTYNVNDFSGSGMAQIFRERGSTVLLVTTLGDTSYKASFESVIRNFSTQLTEIESNVCIANSSGISNYFFKMPEDSDQVSYKGSQGNFSFFWDKYKFWLLGLLLILVVLAFFFVRNKVKKSQEIV